MVAQQASLPVTLLAGHKSLQSETARELKPPPAEVWLGTYHVREGKLRRHC
jgi:hypothetical protein